MAWKNTLQRSFADSLLYKHAALTELDDIQNLIDWSEIEQRFLSLQTAQEISVKPWSKLGAVGWSICDAD